MVVRINQGFLVASKTGNEYTGRAGKLEPACVVMEFDNAALEYDPEVPATLYQLKLGELVPLIDALTKLADELGVAR